VVVLAPGHARRDREVVQSERLRAQRAPNLAHGAARPFALERVDIDERVAHHILKTPNLVSRIGAFNEADNPSARTRRVSSGSITPSSQSRAVE
jgi:hypothetical protein